MPRIPSQTAFRSYPSCPSSPAPNLCMNAIVRPRIIVNSHSQEIYRGSYYQLKEKLNFHFYAFESPPRGVRKTVKIQRKNTRISPTAKPIMPKISGRYQLDLAINLGGTVTSDLPI